MVKYFLQITQILYEISRVPRLNRNNSTMAELNMPAQKGNRRKRVTPRVELTPMVDLGFLLITFFMFTTSLMDPRELVINMPAAGPPETAFIDTSSITVIPVKHHKIVYYHGQLTKDNLQITDHPNLRHILMQKQHALKQLPSTFSAEAYHLHVTIKPGDDSKYDDLVKVVDDMLIHQVKYYAILDLSEEEEKALKKMAY